eukprot:2662178-Rhodomonas_salina.4
MLRNICGTELGDAPLSAYARATRCPVLSWAMLLPESVHFIAGIVGVVLFPVGTRPLCSYALPTRCPVLTWAMLLCDAGTDAGYAATHLLRHAQF